MSLRKFARLAGVAAVLFPFATCTDFTGPSGRGVRVPVAPTFSPAATFAKALYSSAGIEFDRVRVLVVRGESEILKDTTVAFSPASAELTLPLVVSAAPGEVVQVTLEYRNPDVVLYSGTATVTTQPIAVTSASTTPIVLLPVGPGAAAETVQISPNGGSFPTTAAVPFTAQAFASGGASIGNAIFGWSVDDASIATVNAQGVLQPTTKGGTVHVRATTLNAKFAEAAVTFVTAPASLAIQSGGNQSAMSFEPLPANVMVKVLDVNGNGVPGATVNFAVLSGGGTITVVNEISDPAGLASVKWTLGDVVGTQSITATATALPNAPLTINATGTERPAAALAFVQQPTKSLMGAAIMPAVTVKAIDDKGRTVSGFAFPIAITFDANPTSAALAGSASKNAVAGVATFSDLSVNKAGKGYTLKAAANGLSSVISAGFDVDQVASSLALAGGGAQTAVIGSQLSPIAVKIADANGTGVPGVTVGFAVTTGGGSIVITNGVTDASGFARVTWTLGSEVGTQSITATVAGLAGSPLVITADATAFPPTALAFVQPPTNVAMGAAITPSVTVRAVDANGQTTSSFTGAVTIAIDANPAGATLGGTLTVNAVAGIATFAGLTVSHAGSGYTLKASATGFANVISSTFDVTPVAASLSVLSGNNQTATIRAALPSPVMVKVADVNGVGVAGITVGFSTASGNGTVAASAITDATGVASVTWTLGNTIGVQSMTATVAGLTGSPLTIGATGTGLPAVGLAFVQHPSNVVMNTVMTPAVTVRAVDVDGNTVTGYTGTIALTLINNPDNATLGGTVSAAASAGIATFSNLTVSIAGSGYALQATSGTLTDATSGTFIVNPPVPVGLAFQVQPSNLLAGGTITPAVTVRIVDANGVTVPGATNAVTIGLSNPLLDVAFFGTKTVNAVNGVATFSDLTVGTVISGLTLTVTSSGLGTATSTAFNISAAPTPSREWTGAISTDWHDAGNWNPIGVPTASDSVTIAAGTNQPVMSATASAYVIVIGAGRTLRVNVPELSVLAGKVVNQGTLWVTSGFFTGDLDNRTGATFKVDGVAGALSVANASGALTQVIGTTAEGTALVLSHGFTNYGTLELTDVGANISAMTVGDSLVNHSGATINVIAGGNGERLISGVVRNYGTVNVPSTRGLALTLAAGNSVNAGAMTFTGGGPFTLYGGDTTTTSFTNTSTGSITLNSSAWEVLAVHLQLQAGTVSGTGVFTTGASQLDVDIARLPLRLHIDAFSLFSGDSLVIPATVTREFLGSTLSQKVVVLGTLRTLLAEEGATDFQNALSIKSNGLVEAEGNTNVGGTLSIAINATLRISAVGEQRLFTVQSDFSNAGNIELTSAGLFETRIRVNGTLTNETSGTIAALGGFGGERIVEGALDNKGAINVSANSYFTLATKSVDNKNTGTITLEGISTVPGVLSAEHLNSFMLLPLDGEGGWMTNAGTIDVGSYRTLYIMYPGKLTNGDGGIISGSGTVEISNNGEIYATLENTAGTIAPGGQGKLDTLRINGVWVLGTGTLDIDIAGVEPGSFDVLDAPGLTTLGGKLSARYLGGYQPGTNGAPSGAIIVGNPFPGSVVIDPAEWGQYVDGGFHIFYSPPPPPGAAKRPPAH